MTSSLKPQSSVSTCNDNVLSGEIMGGEGRPTNSCEYRNDGRDIVAKFKVVFGLDHKKRQEVNVFS